MDRIGSDVERLIDSLRKVEDGHNMLVRIAQEHGESIRLLHEAIERLERRTEPSSLTKILSMNREY